MKAPTAAPALMPALAVVDKPVSVCVEFPDPVVFNAVVKVEEVGVVKEQREEDDTVTEDEMGDAGSV